MATFVGVRHGPQRSTRSFEGSIWEDAVTFPQSTNRGLSNVVYDADQEEWLAATDHTSTDAYRFWSSPDGESWTTRATWPSLPSQLDGCRILAVAGGVILWGDRGASGQTYWQTSTDGGETWTARNSSSGGAGDFLDAVGLDDGTFIAVLDNGRVLRSTDGAETFAHVGDVPSSNTASLDFGDGVLICTADAATVQRSTDLGDNWTAVATGGDRMRAVAYGAGVWVVWDQDGWARSTNGGVSWTFTDGAPFTDRFSLGPKLSDYGGGLFIVRSDSGPGDPDPERVMTSQDGVTWELWSTPFHIVGLAAAPGQPPNAPNLTSPSDGAVINRQSTVRFRWVFDDPDPGDSQSGFDLQIREQNETPLEVDVSQESPNQFYDLPGSTLPVGLFEWRARTTDSTGLVGDWSSWEPFEADDPPPGPTITDPTVDQTIAALLYTVHWSAAEQDDYELRRVSDDNGSPDTSDVLWTSGVVSSSSTRQLEVEFPTNQVTEHVQLRVRRNDLWADWASVRVDVSYTPPATPTAEVTAFQSQGRIRIRSLRPDPEGSEPTVVSYRVFRRVTSEGGGGIRLAVDVSADASWSDYTVASGVDYQYRTIDIGDNGTPAASDWQG